MKLSDFRVLTLDCYGTLIDWESGISAALRPLASKSPVAIPRAQMLQTFAKHEVAQQAQTPAMPYSQLLSVVYQRVAAEWAVSASNKEAAAFGASIPDWPEFSDSVNALHYLKGHYKLVILSNVDRMSFRASNERLKVDFDAIYCAQDIGSYKPDPRNFEYLLMRLKTDFGLDRADILHTAQSLFHDHALANQFEVASAWITRGQDRQGSGATLAPVVMPRYDFRFDDMAGMVSAHRRELL